MDHGLTAVSSRDAPTEPTFLGRVVQEVATIKGVTTDEVAEIVTENAVRLFRLQRVH